MQIYRRQKIIRALLMAVSLITAIFICASTVFAQEKAASASTLNRVHSPFSSQFISQSVPLAMEPGKKYPVSLTFKNTGKVPWISPIFVLGSQNPAGNKTWSVKEVNLIRHEQIKPGQSKTFTFLVTAPLKRGIYDFQWQMKTKHYGYFGEKSVNLIIKVNSPPVLNPIGDKSTYEDKPLQFEVSATDKDLDVLTYSASNLPQGAVFDNATRTFHWNPQHGQKGTYPNIHFEVWDGIATASQDITMDVRKTVIFGTIYEIGPDHQPVGLEGASIQILDITRTTVLAEALTIATGHFDVFQESWQDGTYVIKASKTGYKTYYGVATLRNNSMMPFVATLVRTEAPIITQEPKNNPIVLGARSVLGHSGEFFWTVTDMTIPARGFPFQFSRTYRSASDYNGPLGYGWTHSYDQRISGAYGSDVTFYDDSGRKDVYSWDGAQYVAPAGFYDKLEYQLATETFTITDRYGTVKKFALQGTLYKLVEIRDRNQNFLTLYYNAAHQVSTIKDTLNRVITFAYTPQGQIDSFSDFYDSENPRIVDFTYDAHGDLWKVTSPLTSDYPEGKTTVYAYYFGQAYPWLEHNLQSITDPKGQTFLVNTFDNVDRVKKQQYGTNAQYYQFSYSPAKTVETDRNGNITDYYLTLAGNCASKIEYTNREIRPGEADYTTSYAYNSNFEITGITYPRGNSVEYTFDITNPDPLARGNLLEIRQKSHISEETDIVNSFTYENRFNQVKTSTEPRGYITTNYFDYEEAGLGDLNGDGFIDQSHGNIVKIKYPDVTLGQPTPQIIEEKFWYNNYGQITRYINGEGNAEVYEYYLLGRGYLKKIIRAAGTLNLTTEYTYDPVGNVLSEKDPRGNITAYGVNELNQITGRAPAVFLNYIITYHYDSCDNLDRVDVHNVDENGIISTANPWFTTTYGYNILDDLTSETEEISETKTITTTYDYDNNQNQYLVTYPVTYPETEGNKTKTEFDERDLVYTVTRGYETADASTETRNYDENGNLWELFDGENHRKEFNQYDGFDRLTATQDALGNWMTYWYYPGQTLVQWKIGFSPLGVVLTRTTYYYDEVKRPYKEERLFNNSSGIPVGDGLATTQWLFDKNSRLTETTDDNNHKTYSFYDQADRLWKTVDALGDPEAGGSGNKVEYTLDPNGNITQVREVERNQLTWPNNDVFITSHIYDELNRRKETHEDPTGLNYVTQFKYDSRNNNVVKIDAENHITRMSVDGLNRLTTNVLDEAGLNIIVRNEWDDNSRLWKQVDANNNTTTNLYNNRGLLKQITYADGTTKAIEYYLDDTVKQVNDANGNIVVNTYNAADLLTERNITRGPGILGTTREVYEYDGAYRMTGARNWDGTTLISDFLWYYDTLSNTDKVKETISTLSLKTIQYTFDGEDNRLSVVYPSGRALTYAPDELNRVTGISSQGGVLGSVGLLADSSLAMYDYAGSRIVGRGCANGTRLEVGYNAVKDITSYKHLNGANNVICGFEYGYTPTHKQTYELGGPLGNLGNVFKYNGVNEVTGAKYGVPGDDIDPHRPWEDYFNWNTKHELDYDGVGNRKMIIKENYGQTAVPTYYNHMGGVYTPDPANRCYKIETSPEPEINRQHDNNATLADDSTYVFQYNYKDELMKAMRKSDLALVGVYNYDCFGNRIMKSTSLGSVGYVLDGSKIIEEYDLAIDIYNADYVYGARDEMLIMNRPAMTGSPFYYLDNALGSISMITTNTGDNVEAYTYSAFGETTAYAWDASQGWYPVIVSQIHNPFCFAGLLYDVEAGLYSASNLSYSPLTGITNTSPIGMPFSNSLDEVLSLCNKVNDVTIMAEKGKTADKVAKATGKAKKTNKRKKEDAREKLQELERKLLELLIKRGNLVKGIGELKVDIAELGEDIRGLEKYRFYAGGGNIIAGWGLLVFFAKYSPLGLVSTTVTYGMVYGQIAALKGTIAKHKTLLRVWEEALRQANKDIGDLERKIKALEKIIADP